MGGSVLRQDTFFLYMERYSGCIGVGYVSCLALLGAGTTAWLVEGFGFLEGLGISEVVWVTLYTSCPGLGRSVQGNPSNLLYT